jgi:hypothetical protein
VRRYRGTGNSDRKPSQPALVCGLGCTGDSDRGQTVRAVEDAATARFSAQRQIAMRQLTGSSVLYLQSCPPRRTIEPLKDEHSREGVEIGECNGCGIHFTGFQTDGSFGGVCADTRTHTTAMRLGQGQNKTWGLGSSLQLLVRYGLEGHRAVQKHTRRAKIDCCCCGRCQGSDWGSKM